MEQSAHENILDNAYMLLLQFLCEQDIYRKSVLLEKLIRHLGKGGQGR